MKKIIYSFLAFAAVTLPISISAKSQQTSADLSSLPHKAVEFIDKTSGIVVSCERESATGEYDVKLDFGLEIEFNRKGEVIEIDAPKHGNIGIDLISLITPKRLVENIKKLDLQTDIKSFERTDNGYKVKAISIMIYELFFNSNGDLITTEYEYIE